MLTAYLHEALASATVEKMENGRCFASISQFPGVWAEAETPENCREELADVLEEWIILSLKRGDRLPVIGSYDLNAVGASL
jgi:predicted RNase H-like HicB family nuclease